MPSRNIVKHYEADHYYHLYTRGVNKQPVFLDDQDFTMFLSLLKRYLSLQPASNPNRHPYPHYGTRLDLLAYCLMTNHIHLLIYQYDSAAIIDAMRSIMTSYSMYFNKKYKRVGPVFQSRYLASPIDKDNYLEHISRYIHLNPFKWKDYPYSSLPYYVHERSAEWIRPDKILALFENNVHDYLRFVRDYEDQKRMLDELKHELAHE